MENLNKLTEKLIQYLEKGEGFIEQQLPDFAQQLLAYATWDAEFALTTRAAILLISLVIGVISFKIARRYEIPGYTSSMIEDLFMLVGVIFCGFGFCMLLSLPSAYKDLKMIELAPKVYLLKMAKEQLR